MPTIQQQREKLIQLLKDLFQLDQPDLDFGFYRIMHAKSAQVSEFLDKDLLKIVEDAFGKDSAAKRTELEQAYQTALQQAKEFGAPDPASAPAVLKAKAALDAAADTASAEADIYDHLYRFFERYYDTGDFLSRRYLSAETSSKAAAFAVPYDGREVYLHWANADQYYIKTSEYFTNFSFDPTAAKEVQDAKGTLFDGKGLPPLKVHFRIVDATEGEHGNVKATEQQKRFFVLNGERPVYFEGGELTVRFEFRPDPEKAGQERTWQGKRNAEAVDGILAVLDSMAKGEKKADDVQGGPSAADLARQYAAVLRAPAPTDKQKDRPVLAKYVAQYTARNTMDYFIHKNLGVFLSRELDFYIKNEVMRLDDIESADAPPVEAYLNRVKVLRAIANKLIEFLAQLEDFQKKLWLKKKFVVETNWCITLDRIIAIEDAKVREALLAEIAANDAQREEWVRFFAIDEVKGDLVRPGYSVPLKVAFLKANDKLLIDTRHFGEDFVHSIEAQMQNRDAGTDGLLLHSENFQAMRLMSARYREQVNCVYIDPPYNTASSAIPYKNDYRHSTWAAMMYDRLRCLADTLRKDGAIFVSIDKTERMILEHAMDSVFGRDNRVEELIWAMNTTNSQVPNYSTNHEYVEVYAKDRRTAEKQPGMFREPKPGFEEVMALMAKLNPEYPPISDIEAALHKLYEQHRIEFQDQIEAMGLEWEDEKGSDPWKGLFNYSHAEYRDEHGSLVSESEARAKRAVIWVWKEADASMPATKQASSTRDPNHPNWRFYQPLHPLTKKPCPHPKSGWKFAYEDDADSPDRRSFVSLDRDSRISWGADENKVPQLKRMLHEVETNIGKSVFQDYSDGEKQTSAMFGQSGLFLAPKHADFVSRFILHANAPDGIVVDSFGGSGSTAHAVIKLNRDDHGRRKYVLVEVNTYFDTVMRPRVMKAAYSPDWRGGKPLSREGISHCIKYLRLESYEDALNNLVLVEDAERDKVLAASAGLHQDYMLRYMLDVETRGSQSLLNVDAFADPTAYKLKVKKPGSDEYAWKNVDLIETFNYLIGLRVEHMAAPQTFAAKFKREKDPELPKDTNTKLVLDGKLKQNAAGPWWFRRIEGWVPAGRNGAREKVLVIWRKLTGNIEQDNLMLDEYFEAHRISTKDWEFDTIYVNGSNNLPNLKRENDTWKVRLIEEDFHRLMWDTQDL